ncbi:MAG: MFS transporter, partial [Coriobacteriia bacterium]
MKKASPSSGPATDAGAYPHRWKVLAATCLALFMVLLDSTIVNVSIPAIADGLGATFAQAEWVLNAYTLVFAAMLVTFGRLGDMFGRKRFFIAGLVIFGIGSLLCGLASSAAFLIGSRVIQALGAAFMMPATLSLTAVNFPPEQRGLAMGIWGAVSGVGSAVGPTLGGVLTDAFSWHYIFFINLPIVLLAIPFALKVIPESRDESPHTVD